MSASRSFSEFFSGKIGSPRVIATLEKGLGIMKLSHDFKTHAFSAFTLIGTTGQLLMIAIWATPCLTFSFGPLGPSGVMAMDIPSLRLLTH